jgi:hypothetical protein
MTDKSPKLSSDRDVWQVEKELSLLQVIEEFFVKTKNKNVSVNDFTNYLLIHKTPYLKVAQAIVKDIQLLGYITIERSRVKASPLLYETIVSYVTTIENYHKKNDFSISILEIDSEFKMIISLLKQLLKEKHGDT